MPITDIGLVKAWGNQDLDASKDLALQACVDAADDWLVHTTGRVIEQTTITRYFSGHDVRSSSMWLPAGHRPVVHTGGDLVVVEEDGEALTVTAIYSADADVVLIGANENRRCEAVRTSGAWSSAWPGNLKFTYKTGWAYGSVPADIIQLANEVAWLLFNSGRTAGKAAINRGRTSVTVNTQDLTALSQTVLERLTVI